MSEHHISAGRSGTGDCKRRPIDHYRKMQKLSYAKTQKPLGDRFWSKVDILDRESCWNWIGCVSGFGHGRFNYDGKSMIASRMAWILSGQSIPRGLYVLHKCDNPKCCNTDHLWLGTKKDNTQDMMKKGRQSDSCKTLTPDAVGSIRQSNKTGPELASEYGVAYCTIWKVKTRRTWGHIA